VTTNEESGDSYGAVKANGGPGRPPTPTSPFMFPRGIASWRIALLLVAACFAVLGLIQEFGTPHAQYVSTAANGTNSVQTTSCITAWDRWTAHYGSSFGYEPNNPYRQSNYEAGSTACSTAIDGREHLFWTAAVLGVLALIGALVLQLMRSRAAGAGMGR